MEGNHRERRSANSAGMKLMNFYDNAHAKFPAFSRLPIELRRNIWRHAIHFPSSHSRIFEVSIESVRIDRDERFKSGRDFAQSKEESDGEECECGSGYHVCDIVRANFEFGFDPANEEYGVVCDLVRADIGLLATCRESRDEYLHVFKFALPGVGGSIIRFSEMDIIYINNPEDELLEDDELCVLNNKDLLPAWFLHIQHLALPGRWNTGENQEIFMVYLPHFSKLQELFVVEYAEDVLNRAFESLDDLDREVVNTQALRSLKENQKDMDEVKASLGAEYANLPDIKLIMSMDGTPSHALITTGCRIKIFEAQSLGRQY